MFCACTCGPDDRQNMGKPVDQAKQVAAVPETPVLVLGFLTAEGKPSIIKMTQRPLGLEFDMRKPIIMSGATPGSIADDLGVKPGWKLTSVNGHDITGRSFQAQWDFLTGSAVRLPEVGVEKKMIMKDVQVEERMMGA
eukprot:gnl/TRDRNA2_/TRDRNA2_184322_c0_seq1.p1 gnl/TRDRNA2_/TRDRNA2_184322_c0~~gnl/TRDRNA2_/TRDRNA2_184322_c0_seq1.p1  ORF type:complete len:138 (+),score=21.77 gnl/TRDRNA2_/TRDRNA2_184322_c0_seq1:88-501(+)